MAIDILLVELLQSLIKLWCMCLFKFILYKLLEQFNFFGLIKLLNTWFKCLVDICIRLDDISPDLLKHKQVCLELLLDGVKDDLEDFAARVHGFTVGILRLFFFRVIFKLKHITFATFSKKHFLTLFELLEEHSFESEVFDVEQCRVCIVSNCLKHETSAGKKISFDI